MENIIDQVASKCIENLEKKVTKPQEPDITAALVTDFPNQINKLLKKLHSFTNCRFGGCFVHQSPIVRFKYGNNNVGCEAGDLLVLCRKKEDGAEQFNATLFQLKMHKTKGFTHSIKKNEIHQLVLYRNWPIFKIENNIRKWKTEIISSQEKEYDIYPKKATTGAQYLFVSNNSPTIHYALFPSMPAETVQLNQCNTWGDFLIGFINWQIGRPVTRENETNKDEWSIFIWDLIEKSRNTVFNRRAAGFNGEKRANGEFFSLMLKHDPIRYDDNNGENDINVIRENLKGAISILFIDVNGDEFEIQQ